MTFKKIMKTSITAVVVTLFCFSLTAITFAADEATGDKGAEKAEQEVVQESTEKLIDLTNPDEVLNPDKYVELMQLAQDWLLINGPGFIVAIIILIIGRWLAMWFASLCKKAMARGKVDETLTRFLGKLIYYALLAAVVIAAADQMGIKTTSFLAIIGAAGLAIGLALKDSLANFASGVMLILFRPFRVGDAVTAAGVTGKVQQVDIFSTIILTPDNQKIIVPNSSITSGVITNINAMPTRRIDLVIGIGYDDDIKLAKNTLEEIIAADSRILTDPAPTVAVAELGASSVDIIVRPWVNSVEYWDVRLDLTEKIKNTFDERNITFPYPQQDVHMFQGTAD